MSKKNDSNKNPKSKSSSGEDKDFVYSKTIRLKNGKILTASECGLGCFKFPRRY